MKGLLLLGILLTTNSIYANSEHAGGWDYMYHVFDKQQLDDTKHAEKIEDDGFDNIWREIF